MPLQQAIIEGVFDKIEADPEWFAVARAYYEGTVNREFTLDGDIDYRDIFLQQHADSSTQGFTTEPVPLFASR